jgi:hypothetical protein
MSRVLVGSPSVGGLRHKHVRLSALVVSSWSATTSPYRCLSASSLPNPVADRCPGNVALYDQPLVEVHILQAPVMPLAALSWPRLTRH